MLDKRAGDYREHTFMVEPYGIEPVPPEDRHGRIVGQWTLWMGSNLTIADFALGFFSIALGLSWTWTLVALIVGNVLGALALGACAGMGPKFGLPQMMISRRVFGRRGGLVPAFLNYLSTIGWFSVNNILGSYGLKILAPSLAYWQAATLLVVVQGLLAVFGHNLIHVYERIMSVVLGVMFAIISGMVLSRPALFQYHPVLKGPVWVPFALVLAASLSYLGSWAPYASDYSRYLPAKTSYRRVFGASFLGGFSASLWLELVGAGVAVASGHGAGNPIALLHGVARGFGFLAVLSIILGGTAADALNLYSNALAAGALNIQLPRWLLAVIASLVGLALSMAGSGSFEGYYENFLLLLGYWLTPWLGVLLTEFFQTRGRKTTGDAFLASWPALGSFLIGLGASVPFMSSALYTGPVAHKLGGADLTFYVGFVVAAGIYALWTRKRADDRTFSYQAG